MSGDAQPRKRKDKKRKKDEGAEQSPPHFQTPPASNVSEDVNIHVHKDEGTGGNLCAKIVFFLLFSALAVVIGLIITEHRGLTDLDTVDTDSRFSQIFEGWTDNGHGHDDESHLEHSPEDHEHDDESHEIEEHDHDDEESEEEPQEDETDEAHDDDEELEEASDEKSDIDDDDEQDITDEDQEDNDNESDQVAESEEQEDDDSENVSEQPDDIISEENDDTNEENSDEDNAQDEEDEDLTVIDSGEKNESQEASEEQNETEDDQEEATSKEENEDDASDNEATPAQLEEDAKESPENPRMAVKIGVGVALLVVAHVVLIRKWKSAPLGDSPTKADESVPDLGRRNTIVVPPALEEVQQDLEESVEEDYSDEDLENESDDDRTELKSAKLRYQELRTTYSRSLTPESEPDYTNKPTGDYEEEYDEGGEEEEDDDEEEDDEDLSDNEEYDKDDEDEELLKRLEAKYGKVKGEKGAEGKSDDFDDQFSSWKRINVRNDNEPEESDSDKQSDDYEYENITSRDDWKIKEKLDEAQKEINKNAAYAIKLFDLLLQNYPSSPRALYGKAQALDRIAELKKSNELLQRAVSVYLQVLGLEQVPDALFKVAGERCINRMRFAGNYNRIASVHLMLIERFPNEPHYRNQLAVSYLTINRVNQARQVLQDTLKKHPDDGFALVHYGFILKTTDNKLNESVDYLRRGIRTRQSGVLDGRFYFHLGDALARLGRNEEATEVYEEGVQNKLFRSRYQRSLYNVQRLKGQPWWTKDETPYRNLYAALEKNWKVIRDEGLAVLSKTGRFQNESENLKDTGDWKQFELFARGHKNVENCKRCPMTCGIIEQIPDAKGCRRGQTKFSVMHPGTHVWPHCGPTNCRLRVHLGLNVPPAKTYIRVADEVRSWENGKILIFDDSFEHEVWHNGTSFRLVLIVDVWHPELTPTEKRSLSPI